MKIALLQFNPTVGDLAGNASAIVDLVRRAHSAGATLAVTAELAVTGYPPRDLLDVHGFVERVEATNARLLAELPGGITVVLGTLGRGACAVRSGLCENQALVLRDGKVICSAAKQLLPSYDVFDEPRYFHPGTGTVVCTIGGRRVAVTVCEDAWANQPGIVQRYAADPLAHGMAQGAELVLNLSASPFTLEKLRGRPAMFSRIARQHQVTVVFVNQVGGNDELVFDGRSTVWDTEGNVVARASMFEGDLLLWDTAEPGAQRVAPEATCEEEAAYRALVLGLRDYTRKCGFKKVVLGLSGGIDSALTAVLATDALGPGNVHGVAMPTRFSSQGSLDDAQALAKNLGITYGVMNIDGIFENMLTELSPFLDAAGQAKPGEVTIENLQARIRGVTLMALSNRTGAMVLTTGNKSELAVGYCTLYGDMVGGLAPLSDLPKAMVYRVSKWINREGVRIPENSISKAPSAELRPDQKDQDSLPPYDILDALLELHIEDQLTAEQILARGYDTEVVGQVLQLVRQSEHKRRQAAPGLIVTRKAFGAGRRMPVARGD